MALPEQVIDKLSREQVDTPGWSSRLLMFSGTVFFISIAVYAGIVFGYKPYLENQIASLDNQIKTYGQQIPPEEQTKLISFYSQIANLRNILGSHIVSSQIFDWLEKNTIPAIYYSKLDLLSPSNQLNLAGYSKSMDDFSKQAILFQNNPLVERIAINSVTAAPGDLWQFDITLFLADNALSQATVQNQP